jgi:hypothetical protein
VTQTITQSIVSKLSPWETVSIPDQILLKFIDGRKMSITDCLANLEMNQDIALSSIQRLIRAGYLHLIVSVYPWGVEYEVRQTGNEMLQ